MQPRSGKEEVKVIEIDLKRALGKMFPEYGNLFRNRRADIYKEIIKKKFVHFHKKED